MKSKSKFLIYVIVIIIVGFLLYFFKFKSNKKNIINNANLNQAITNTEISGNNEIIDNSESTSFNQNNENTASSNGNDENNSQNEIVLTFSPSGFAGSSLNVVRYYVNGDVYVVTYNGEGTNDSDIVKNVLIAQNVDSVRNVTADDIEKDNSIEEGSIIISGKDLKIVNKDYDWIIFEN